MSLPLSPLPFDADNVLPLPHDLGALEVIQRFEISHKTSVRINLISPQQSVLDSILINLDGSRPAPVKKLDDFLKNYKIALQEDEIRALLQAARICPVDHEDSRGDAWERNFEMEITALFPLIKYVSEIKEWRHYNGKYYEVVHENIIFQRIERWIEQNQLSSTLLDVCKRKVSLHRDICTYLKDWDSDDCIILQNGTYFRKTHTLQPHSPLLLYSQIWDVHFIPGVWICPPAWAQLLDGLAEKDAERFSKMMQNIVQAYRTDRKFYILYGPRNSGKSTALNMLYSFIPRQFISAQKMENFYKDFGLENVYNKILNSDEEISDVSFTQENIGLLKKMCDEKGMVDVTKKNVNGFTVSWKTFIVGACNHLPGFVAGIDKQSIYKRAALIHFAISHDTDSAFERALEAEKDRIFSWYLTQQSYNINDEISTRQWIAEISFIWETEKDIIATLVKNRYVYASPYDHKEADGSFRKWHHKIPIPHVYKYIWESLREKQVEPPESREIYKQIADTFSQMGISKDRNAKYQDVMEIGQKIDNIGDEEPPSPDIPADE